MRQLFIVILILLFAQQTYSAKVSTNKVKTRKAKNALAVANAPSPVVETMNSNKFGKIMIYKPVQVPTSVAFLVSDAGGWDNGMAQLAKSIQQQGALVIGLDFNSYMHYLAANNKKCYYPAGHFEALSMLVQKKYKIAQYHKPIIIGVSESSALVYGTFAQSPANTFRGAIAIDFTPSINVSKAFCTGSGLKQHPSKDGNSYIFDPVDNLSSSFVALEGIKDPAYPSIQQFIKNLKMGQLIPINNQAHLVADALSWQNQFQAAYKKMVVEPSFVEKQNAQNKLLRAQHLKPFTGELPLAIVPSEKQDALPMVFLISGDGGWTSFDQSFAESLSQRGFSVLGLDAQKYFWNKKSPEQTTNDISKAIVFYMGQWHKTQFILAGYSFGACVVPFIANRLSPDMKKLFAGIYCYSPDEKADFEIHIADLLSFGSSDDKYSVVDEAKLIKNMRPVFIFGLAEDSVHRSHFVQQGIRIITLPGNHHYNENTNAMAETILKDFKH